MSNKNNKYVSKDCSDFLFEELKELIGPSTGLFNRAKYKKKIKMKNMRNLEYHL